MYIQSIEINNYRFIDSNPALKLNISDLTVLSGINDKGKNSVLEEGTALPVWDFLREFNKTI